MKSLLSLVLAIAVSMPAAAQAPAPVTTGRIRGRIVQAGTNTPVRRARVQLTGESTLQREVTSDADGRYEFSSLPAGRFTVSAAKGGFVTTLYGQRHGFGPGKPIVLADKQSLASADIALPRGGVIVGRITDRFGDPLVGAEVRVERYQYGPDGQRRLTRGTTGPATTNDRGEFRAFGLRPGEYVVSASVRERPVPPGQTASSQPTDGMIATYFPGTAQASEAATIRLDAGQEAPVQFGMMSGRLSRVSGTVVDSSGRPAAGASLMLATTAETSIGARGMGSGSVAADGSFALGNLAPGQHYIQVRLQGRPGGVPSEFANVPFSATGESVAGLVITTSLATTVAGRVEWEGRAARSGGSQPLGVTIASADARPMMIGAVTTDDPSANGLVGSDGRFRIGGAMGNVAFRVAGIPPLWTLKAVMLGGTDITDTGTDALALTNDAEIRVVLTDTVTTIAGSVTHATGGAVTDHVVVVLPEQPVSLNAARYTHVVRPDEQGRFELRALPPGRYVAAAVDAPEQGSEWDPVFQASIRNAARAFTLTEGQSVTLDFIVTP